MDKEAEILETLGIHDWIYLSKNEMGGDLYWERRVCLICEIVELLVPHKGWEPVIFPEPKTVYLAKEKAWKTKDQ
jgi:hypothetical protein